MSEIDDLEDIAYQLRTNGNPGGRLRNSAKLLRSSNKNTVNNGRAVAAKSADAEQRHRQLRAEKSWASRRSHV